MGGGSTVTVREIMFPIYEVYILGCFSVEELLTHDCACFVLLHIHLTVVIMRLEGQCCIIVLSISYLTNYLMKCYRYFQHNQ